MFGYITNILLTSQTFCQLLRIIFTHSQQWHFKSLLIANYILIHGFEDRHWVDGIIVYHIVLPFLRTFTVTGRSFGELESAVLAGQHAVLGLGVLLHHGSDDGDTALV